MQQLTSDGGVELLEPGPAVLLAMAGLVATSRSGGSLLVFLLPCSPAKPHSTEFLTKSVEKVGGCRLREKSCRLRRRLL